MTYFVNIEILQLTLQIDQNQRLENIFYSLTSSIHGKKGFLCPKMKMDYCLNPNSHQIPRFLKRRNPRRLPAQINLAAKETEPDYQTQSNKLLLCLKGNSRATNM